MRQYDLLGDVAANDALYYQQKGHPNAFYIQNIWIDRFGASWEETRQRLEIKTPAKIIVNVGQLGATANRYGMEILAKEVAPALRDLLREIPYELHILGKGEIIEPLRRLLDSPEIKIRGFVDDIDKEFFEASLFVCLNNASPFKVGHTRYLHAWSLGICVIAHRDAALSMPEIRMSIMRFWAPMRAISPNTSNVRYSSRRSGTASAKMATPHSHARLAARRSPGDYGRKFHRARNNYRA